MDVDVYPVDVIKCIVAVQLVDAAALDGAVVVEANPEWDGVVASHWSSPLPSFTVKELGYLPAFPDEGGCGIGIVAVDFAHTCRVDIVGRKGNAGDTT